MMQLLAFRGSSASSIETLSLVTGIGFLDSLNLSFGAPGLQGRHAAWLANYYNC